MKKILLLLCMLITYSLSFAQVEKGKWFAAGYSSLRLDIEKDKSGPAGDLSDEYSYRRFNFDPMVGYFVMEKLPVGLYFDIYSDREKDEWDGDVDKTSEFIVGPFARYYIKQFDKLIPFAEARVGIGAYKETYSDGDTYTESAFSYRFGAGASYFFTENVAFDAFLGYDYDGYTDKSDDPKSTYIYSSIEMNFGLVITFGKQ
jgi:opacity protein-like surface antigen